MAARLSGLERINAAAIRVIGRKGFAQVTTQQIARAARVSEGLIFRYYRTKLDLGRRLFRTHYARILARLKDVGARHEDPLERIRNVAKEFYRWFDADRDVASFLIRTHHEFLDGTGQEQGFIFLASLALKDILGERLFRVFPADIVSAMLVGMFLQVGVECMHGQAAGPLAPRMEPVIDALVDFARRSVPQAVFASGSGQPADPSPEP